MKKRNIFAIFLLLLFALSLPAQAKPQGSIYVDASSNLETEIHLKTHLLQIKRLPEKFIRR